MNSPRSSAKIINHSHGQGTTGLGDIRQRAMELAVINGRAATDFTETDWDQAAMELRGGHHGITASEDAIMEMTIGSDLVAGSLGHHVPNHPVDESEGAAEELIMEGMDEAEHERMLEASRVDQDENL